MRRAPGTGCGYGGAVLLRDKVELTTAPEARLYKKAAADKSVPSYQGRSVSAGRQNGLRRRNENRKPAAQPAGGTKKSLRKSTRAEKHEFFRSL